MNETDVIEAPEARIGEQKRWRLTIEMTRTDHVLTRLGGHVDVYLRADPGPQQAVIVGIEEIK